MKRTISAVAALAAGVAFAGLTTSSAYAADIPCNTARLIVPWGAGGESDILMRITNEAFNRLGGKPQMQVVTISGQGGIKGSKAAMKAKPDGCTVFSTFQHLISSNLTGRIDFSWDAYQPVAKMTQTMSLIGAGTKAPFKNYKEMQTWAKANPNKLLAAGTLGSTSHFTMLQLQDALGIEMKVVSYDGTADRMKAMLANTVHIGQVSESTGAKHLQTGSLQILGINYKVRSKVLTEVPTAMEQGFDLSITSDRGWVLPKGTPKEINTHYADMLEKVSKDKKFIDAIEAKGSFVSFLRDEEYVQWWKDTDAEWTGIAKRLGVMRK